MSKSACQQTKLAYFYYDIADSGIVVAPGQFVPFPKSGVSNTCCIKRKSNTEFILRDVGFYQIAYRICANSNLDGIAVKIVSDGKYLDPGSLAFGGLIVSDTIPIEITKPNTTISITNVPAGYGSFTTAATGSLFITRLA